VKLEGLKDKIRKYSVAEPNSGCWLLERGIAENGYGLMHWDGKDRLTHRLSYMAFNGPIPEGMCVCHRCDTKSCVRPSHLWLGSKASNSRDMVQKGRNVTQRGEDHYRTQLTESQAEEAIVLRYLCGYTFKEIGLKLDAEISTLGNICRGRSWTQLAGFREEILSMATGSGMPAVEMSPDRFREVLDILFEDIKNNPQTDLIRVGN